MIILLYDRIVDAAKYVQQHEPQDQGVVAVKRVRAPPMQQSLLRGGVVQAFHELMKHGHLQQTKKKGARVLSCIVTLSSTSSEMTRTVHNFISRSWATRTREQLNEDT